MLYTKSLQFPDFFNIKPASKAMLSLFKKKGVIFYAIKIYTENTIKND